MLSEVHQKQKDDSSTIPGKGSRLVLFDFDGTITTRDTLAEFMIFYHGRTRYYFGLACLSPILALYVLKLIPNWKGKEYFLRWFLSNEKASEVDLAGKRFATHLLPKLIRPKALESIRQYQDAGAVVAIVSASAVNWVKPWCDMNNLICIATKLEIKDDKFTGKISGKNCHGAEKVCRIREAFSLDEFDEIIAFGDTSGDKEMLALAHKSFYKPFRS